MYIWYLNEWGGVASLGESVDLSARAQARDQIPKAVKKTEGASLRTEESPVGS